MTGIQYRDQEVTEEGTSCCSLQRIGAFALSVPFGGLDYPTFLLWVSYLLVARYARAWVLSFPDFFCKETF